MTTLTGLSLLVLLVMTLIVVIGQLSKKINNQRWSTNHISEESLVHILNGLYKGHRTT